MVELFLAPASRKYNDKPYQHLQESIVSGIKKEGYEDFTDTDTGSPARIWGVVEGSKGTWNKINAGDWVLFYVGYDEYEYAAKVLAKEKNPELARHLWSDYFSGALGGDDPQEPWNYLIYLTDLRKIELPSPKLHNKLGYVQTYPTRFQRVTRSRLQNLKSEYGSLDDFVEEYEN